MSFRLRLRTILWHLLRKTDPPQPDQAQINRHLNEALRSMAPQQDAGKAAYMERVTELVEARQMAGSGPWQQPSPATMLATDRMVNEADKRFGKPITTREALSYSGSADLELVLQTLEWRREVNFSWLEFSRNGIQQIILVCRLYYIKHPWIRRGVNLSAAYVFGQGVELSSPDAGANDVLQRFRARNAVSLGQIALTEQEKRKAYDGNIFWCLFADTQNKGETDVRVIDSTEITEIVTDPDDADSPRFYRRVWATRTFDLKTGQWGSETNQKWYPALNYEPEVKDPVIGGFPVAWDSPIYHRRVGHVAAWTFGCPRVYPAVDWAREGKRHLDACASVTQALARVAIDITTKGGQQAVEGIRAQVQAGPSSDIRDLERGQAGSAFIHGPGTKIEAFRSRGAGASPEDVKEYRNMVACALEIPPTWLGDMETSNLSTAQTLDRPTELGFLLKQEEWQEDLVTMGMYALRVSKSAPSGRLRESLKDAAQTVEIREAARVTKRGHWVYEAATVKQENVIEVLCNFPAIREGDIEEMVTATVQGLTLGASDGSIHGIDAKAGIRKLYDLVGIDDGDQLAEMQYPKATYEPDRTLEPPAPAAPPAKPTKPTVAEAARIRAALDRVNAALETNGTRSTH